MFKKTKICVFPVAIIFFTLSQFGYAQEESGISDSIDLADKSENRQLNKRLFSDESKEEADASLNSNKVLSITDVIALALKWHPSIKKAESIVLEEKEKVKIAKSRYFPTLSANLNKELLVDSGSEKNDPQLGLKLSQNIYDFGRTSSYVKSAELGVSKEEYSSVMDKHNLAYNVARAFIETLRYKKLIEVANKQLAGFNVIEKLSKKRTSLGASSKSDYSQTVVKVKASEVQLYSYQINYRKSSTLLQTYANVTLNINKLSEKLPEYFINSCSNIQDSDVENSPVIKYHRIQEQILGSELKSAKSDYYPTISVDVSYARKLNQQKIKNNIFDNRSNKKNNYSVGLNVSIPIFQGGADLAKVNKASQAMITALNSSDEALTIAKQNILMSKNQVSIYSSMIESLKAKENSAIQTRDLYKSQYIMLGNRNLLDLLSVESDIHQSRIDIINNIYDEYLLHIDCLYQAGKILN